MAPTGESQGGSDHGPTDSAARWVAKFDVHRQRRVGAAGPLPPALVAEFLRFIAVRWQVPEWQQAQAEGALNHQWSIAAGDVLPAPDPGDRRRPVRSRVKPIWSSGKREVG